LQTAINDKSNNEEFLQVNLTSSRPWGVVPPEPQLSDQPSTGIPGHLLLRRNLHRSSGCTPVFSPSALRVRGHSKRACGQRLPEAGGLVAYPGDANSCEPLDRVTVRIGLQVGLVRFSAVRCSTSRVAVIRPAVYRYSRTLTT
jgi:hypothetical protein